MLKNAYKFKNENTYKVLHLSGINVDNKYFKKLSGIDAILLKIRNQFKQQKGTLFYDRNIGTSIHQYVFENNLDEIKDQIKATLVEEITTNIPELSVQDITITEERTLDNRIAYKIELILKYAETSFVINLFVNEVSIVIE